MESRTGICRKEEKIRRRRILLFPLSSGINPPNFPIYTGRLRQKKKWLAAAAVEKGRKYGP